MYLSIYPSIYQSFYAFSHHVNELIKIDLSITVFINISYDCNPDLSIHSCFSSNNLRKLLGRNLAGSVGVEFVESMSKLLLL